MTTPLSEKIKTIIRHSGPLSVTDYFAICLADPQHGYYMTREPFGRTGDFITAPEISQLFGEMLGIFMVPLCGWFFSGSFTGEFSSWFSLLVVGGLLFLLHQSRGHVQPVDPSVRQAPVPPPTPPVAPTMPFYPQPPVPPVPPVAR